MAIYNENELLKKIGAQVPEESFANLPEDTETDLEGVPALEMPEIGMKEESQATEDVSPQQKMLEEYRSLKNTNEKPEKQLSERELTLQALKRNIEEMQKTPEKKELTTGEYLPDVLAGLYNIYNFAQGNQQPSMQMGSISSAQKAREMEESSRQARLGKLQDMYTNYLNMLGKEQKTPSEMEKIELETAKEKLKQLREPKEPSWEEKEVKKAEIEQKIETDKEKRKETAEIKKSMSDIDEQLATVRKAKQQLAKVMKNKLADTGPIDQYISARTKQGQLLKQTLSELSLKKMSKMFEGMSKAIDTGPEREIFESSQASLDKYSDNNMQILEDQEKALLNLKKKNNERINEISQNREQIQESSTSQKELSPIYGEVTERNGKKYKWNPSARKYQLID